MADHDKLGKLQKNRILQGFGTYVTFLKKYLHRKQPQKLRVLRVRLNKHLNGYGDRNFSENFIFANSVKRHICNVKNSLLGHD